jgi:hypothetical protein
MIYRKKPSFSAAGTKYLLKLHRKQRNGKVTPKQVYVALRGPGG